MKKKGYEDDVVRPIKGDATLKEYHCPFCKGFLLRGNVKKLTLACPYCNELIKAEETELSGK